MATEIQLVIDRADPGGLARFWVEALHDEMQDPPAGFQTWHDFLRAQGVREESWNDASAIVDPETVGPRICFQRVPERSAGANVVRPGSVERGEYRVVMQDPEGNEFCVQ